MPSEILSAPWKLSDFAPGEGRIAGAQQVDFDDRAWLPVNVPGGVYPVLIAAGRIEVPF